MSVAFEVFHLEISGKDNKEEQFLNIDLISLIFEVSHFEISGKEINDVQP